jgi:hypothetical protein
VGTSTCLGSRTASTPATTKTTAVAASDHSKPNAAASPAPTAPAIPAVASPNTESRAFADVRDMADGSTRGTTAARRTLWDFDSTRMPSAAG